MWTKRNSIKTELSKQQSNSLNWADRWRERERGKQTRRRTSRARAGGKAAQCFFFPFFASVAIRVKVTTNSSIRAERRQDLGLDDNKTHSGSGKKKVKGNDRNIKKKKENKTEMKVQPPTCGAEEKVYIYFKLMDLNFT